MSDTFDDHDDAHDPAVCMECRIRGAIFGNPPKPGVVLLCDPSLANDALNAMSNIAAVMLAYTTDAMAEDYVRELLNTRTEAQEHLRIATEKLQ